MRLMGRREAMGGHPLWNFSLFVPSVMPWPGLACMMLLRLRNLFSPGGFVLRCSGWCLMPTWPILQADLAL